MFGTYICVNTDDRTVESTLDMTAQMALDCNREYQLDGSPQRWVPLAQDEDEQLCA